MTRLRPKDIYDIPIRLNEYDRELIDKTGCTLQGIACHTFGIPEETFLSMAVSAEVGIIPIASGQGIIEGFTKAVRHIVQHIGFRTFVTRHTDVAGIAEAVEKNAEVIMMADDQRFVALNIRSSRLVDNAEATGKGFVAGLDLMASGLKQKKVLVIGCGSVGRSAILAALLRGADVSVFDINLQTSYQLARDIRKSTKKIIGVERELEPALSHYHLLVETTNDAGIIDAEFIHPYTYIAAPGMPLGLSPAAVKKISGRLLHDPLQIGVAVMAVDGVMSRSVEDWRIMLPYASYLARPLDAKANPDSKDSDQKHKNGKETKK
ncbi:MAG: 3-methylornithyl-N6-L-lysine dehydrogenase PylD [Candidatus Aminicenantes bacterium]|nr:3-methylornithyl-N6-L-lysine dehydrogenase PylD [Candidatus Aminicenantes bacterium]NIM83738.1 3-methylornithyl-N6-L-lysine dehydrogenase PylD [Candidatus Aminicenantes bacterium]NIN23198.1 3-methylornithyl-N6-L-lysine dehydrogenase PylD [Candidatus Aminicenantes bacterium]NIN46892.1 3-methylornithyl-N6-L-lysine dehydrogenase PylD [Candidatus Aminicenantes bacterium]NIN89814.1 3-methylornithyl-N6-L-lysine dehydrogenase PylD [Candidatus Aminicenantes bacterium]